MITCSSDHHPARRRADIIAGGLYKALALAFYPGLFRPVSIALVAKKLGSVGGTLSWRSGLHLGKSRRDSMATVQLVQLPPRASSEVGVGVAGGSSDQNKVVQAQEADASTSKSDMDVEKL